MMGKKFRQSSHTPLFPYINTDASTDSSDENRAASQENSGQHGCPHIRKSVNPLKVRKSARWNGIQVDVCSECQKMSPSTGDIVVESPESDLYEIDKTLWMCLNCGSQLCGRARNQHALKHFQTPRSDEHTMCVNTTTLEVWCYGCDTAINSDAHKKVLECVEVIKKESSKPHNNINNVESKYTDLNHTFPTQSSDGFLKNSSGQANNQTKGDIQVVATIESLPRVRGLTNLGNTCFFNAVLQCLAQTPYLLKILKESVEPGEKFTLPGGILKFNDGSETSLIPIEGTLKIGGQLTLELGSTMENLQMGGGVFNPRLLLTQLRRKWPQFEGHDQHDSHELLRHLLESVRAEDLRRYQTFILTILGMNTKINPASVEGEMKQKVKFYGNQATNHMDVMRRPDQVFKGYLVSTLTCQECYHNSSRHESFLDISLPVNVEKPQPPTRRKSSPEPPSKYQLKKEKEKERKLKRTNKHKPKNECTNGEDAAAGADENDESKSNSDSGEQSDADVEDNITDENAKPIAASPIDPEKKDDVPENPDKDSNDDATASERQSNTILERGLSADGYQNLKKMIEENDGLRTDFHSKLSLNDSKKLNKLKKSNRIRSISHSDWSNTFGPRYQCEDGECSVQSCLNSFTSVELMTGQNKVGCENCTERTNGKDGKTVNTNATKQFLISIPPAVLILHLKRFQVGPRHMFRKLTKPVSFPLILDIAPFCGSKVKNQPNVNRTQKKILYSLYGIVEHSGTIHSGHYVAYVKVRAPLSDDDPRWSFLPQGSKSMLDRIDQAKPNQLDELMNNDHDSDDSSTSSEEGAVGGSDEPDVKPPPGKWYYISDSRVQEVSEESIKNTQAYLLFYERIY